MIAVIGAADTWVNGKIWPTPAGMATDWAAQRLFLYGSPGITTLVTPAPARDARAALADWEWPRHSDWIQSGWVTLSKGQGNFRRWLHIGLLDHLGSDPLIGGFTTPVLIGEGLKRWHALTGAEYRTSPAVAAVASIREITKRHKRPPRWILQNKATAEWWQPPGQIHDLNYNMAEPWRQLYFYDRRAAYLASAAAVQLPYGELRPTGYDYDPRCGYYNVRINNMSGWLGVPVAEMLGPPDHNGAVWVCQDTLAVLRDNGWNCEVIDSWSTDQSGRILRPWAEKWRDAMESMSPLARPALKAGYAQALGGLFAVPRGTVYRPDFRHMIMDNNRAHMLRVALSVYKHNGIWPSRVTVDALYYHQPQPTIPLGDRIGNMVAQGWHTPIPFRNPTLEPNDES